MWWLLLLTLNGIEGASFIQTSSKLESITSFQVGNCPLVKNDTLNGAWKNLTSECDLDLSKSKTDDDGLLCFGSYDSFVKLCQMNDSKLNFDINSTGMPNPTFCQSASTLFSKYDNSSLSSVKLAQQWLSTFQNTFKNNTLCPILCENLQLNIKPKCLFIYKVNEKYNTWKNLQKNVYSVVETKKIEEDKQQREVSKVKDTPPVFKNPTQGVVQTETIPVVEEKKTSPTAPKQPENNEFNNNEPSLGDTIPQHSTYDKPGNDPELNDGEGIDDSGKSDNVNQDLEINPYEKDDMRPIIETKEQRSEFMNEEDSNFFSYFIFIVIISFIAYIAYHNKNKLIALVLEGRRTRSGRGSRDSRHSSTSYSKLNSNLEETVSNSCAPPSAKHVIY